MLKKLAKTGFFAALGDVLVTVHTHHQLSGFVSLTTSKRLPVVVLVELVGLFEVLLIT